ncbi:CGCGG family putative rSAM-modified RiPP protein [Halobellus ruber]|uniref:CGCGG family rSAM-modified RiPP protein n=1 Tax=Halobellus ruber TaxID=2761102 RepID=A0A7J9SLC3_9EURY|nr:CGCGG family rSAM-modified RiPP protein [Halobellus ruber]
MFGTTALRGPVEPAGTSTDTDDHDVEAGPVKRVHDNSWSADLEGPDHAADREFLVEQALSAVDHTTPGEHGHPETYLYDALAREYGDEMEWEYVDQCGCGGHVVRVYA